MEDVLGTCLERGIKVVSNAGGLNPAGLVAQLNHLAARLGLAARVAYVDGDDLSGRIEEIVAAGYPLANLDTGQPLADAGVEPVTANAYLGGWGIAAALTAGADIVVCGRVTDASLVVGPAAWWHGWERTDFDALAGAVAAGHIIECGPQATGGNYAWLAEITDRRYPGFPIAEVGADGSSVITKHPDTGGLVTTDTVTAQLLYEIAGPEYLNRRRGCAFRHGAADPTGSGSGLGQCDARIPSAVDVEGRDQLLGRLPEHHDLGPHRPRHSREGGLGRAGAVRPARWARSVRRGRRAPAAL